MVFSLTFDVTCTPYCTQARELTHPSGQMSQVHIAVRLVNVPGAQDLGWSDPVGQCRPIGQTAGFGTLLPSGQ